jgi:DNA-3-methyladenine glycosylase
MTDLPAEFFLQDALIVAPRLLGCRLAVDGRELVITETEAYRGEGDTACHAHHGRTKRTEMLYRRGGHVYVYLCYGIHNLLNIITGEVDDPQGVLIRCCASAAGPGKLTKRLGIDLSFNGLDILRTDRIGLWQGPEYAYETATRVGIGYASQEDQERLWRFIMKGN